MGTMASVRRLAALGVCAGIVALSGVASAQDPVNNSVTDVPPLWRAVANFVLTLLLGAALVGWGYNYVARITGRIREEPGASFAWGLGLLVVAAVGGAILAVLGGILGSLIFVAIVLGLLVVAVVGTIMAYLTLFGAVVENQWVALGLTAITSAVVSFVPVVGPIVGFVTTSVGVGAIARDYRA